MKLIFVYGPTCSGKTELAIQLSEKFGGEIISCDSVQIYKHLEIGSAKPNSQELARAKHHLISMIDFPEKYTAARFAREAKAKITDLEKAGEKLCYVVGGTGFYFQALESGMDESLEVPKEVSEYYKVETQRNPIAMFKLLQLKDPDYAQKISPNDIYRISRALELLHINKKPSENFSKKPSQLPYPVFKIFLNPDRKKLKQKMELRSKKMLDAGLVEEVKDLVDRGYSDWEALQSVGYKQVLEYLKGDLAEAELAYWITTRSMQLAKRQRTWFQRDKEAYELKDPEQESDLIQALADFIDI